MGQGAFFRALVEHGRIAVGPPGRSAATRDDLDGGDTDIGATLASWDAANRLEFPGEAPPLDVDAARWALLRLYQACQFAVHRDAGAAEMAAAFANACPLAPPASLHYSVDLVFRFLPDLYRLTKSASAGDPLCEHLRQWAAAWPLSSVGIAGVNPADLSAVCEHASLLRMYSDRVIARRDTSRLADPRVRSAVRAAIGHFDDLAEPIAAALKKYDQPDAAEPANVVAP